MIMKNKTVRLVPTTTRIEMINLVVVVLIGRIGRDVKMNEREAIEILQEEHDYAQLLSYVNSALNLAISALEKQIPKKPDLEGDGYDDNGELIYDTWICPCCGKYYEVYYEEYEFCPQCGQAIDWTE